MGNRKILVSLTTLSEKNIKNDWRRTISELNKFRIEEIALFLTITKREERSEIYEQLEKSSVKSIPHVHLRTDMKVEELDYLVEKYNTRFFNLHPTAGYPLIEDFSKYFSKIYVENTTQIPSDEELKTFAGLCVDFSHWEDRRLANNVEYCRDMENKVKKYKIGCCHVSAILKKPENVSPHYSGREQYDTHLLKKVSELDYIKRYVKYLPEYISLELENPISEQLEAKEYIEEIIKAKENNSDAS